MPRQILPTLVCFPLLVPRVHLQHFRLSLAHPWEEEGSWRNPHIDHCWDGQQESVRSHPKYPSVPQETREELIQSHPKAPLGHPAVTLHTFLQHRQLGLCSAWQSPALLKSAPVCLAS